MRQHRFIATLAVVAISALTAGCLGPLGVPAVPGTQNGPPAQLVVDHPDRCDPLDARACLLPFPSDHFTVADHTTATGRRLALDIASMPTNVSGTPFDPADLNRNDGFSPGNALLTYVPGLSIERTGMATTRDIGASLDADAPAVIVDATTGERWPYFAELDAQAPTPGDQLLIVRPARNLLEGHRYVVALRDLRDDAGDVIAAGDVFRAYRDHVPTRNPALEARRGDMERIFRDLRRAGVEREDLYLAWDFTVASERNLSERMLHIRDDAFASLAGAAPAFHVNSVLTNVNADTARRITGTFDVPLYLTGNGSPGATFDWGVDGLPQRNGTWHANFTCVVPPAALAEPARAVVYGHGLLGSANEVNSFARLANTHGLVMCATSWIGMSSEDVPNVVSILQDNSHFASLADRAQQGMLDMLFLARLLRVDDGFATDPAFRTAAGTPVFRTGEVFFNGNSQGGIMGGAVTAVSTEWTRAALGVPGMNYSTLLTRSVDYDPFSAVASAAYPDPLLRTVQLSLIQLLWDRAEANGYAQHMTDDPYPGTPAHDVLLFEAFGDHQVANVTTNAEARTIGARLRLPALAPGRTPDVDPYFGIAPLDPAHADGSVLVVWDFGTPAPPPDNTPPRPPQYGSDPHGAGSSEPRVGQMVSDFLRTDGAFVDPCAPGVPCSTP